jgi:uncharacterized protein YqeY
MSLKQRITDNLKKAMLAGNSFEADALRSLKAAVLNEEVAQHKREEGLQDTEIEQIVAREIKKRDESARMYTDAGRQELADNEQKEAEVLKGFLPEQLSEEKITEVVRRIIKESGAEGMSAMGQTIGATKKELGNSADGATVARIVKQELGS